VEDFVMADIGMNPLMVVTLEGIFGSLAMFGVLLPVVQVCAKGVAHALGGPIWHAH
jgi:hypothetical protein